MVSASPGLTAKWLVPRIYRFLEKHPDVDTRISSSSTISNFTTDGVDVGIRLSSGVHPDLYVEKLSDECDAAAVQPAPARGRASPAHAARSAALPADPDRPAGLGADLGRLAGRRWG